MKNPFTVWDLRLCQLWAIRKSIQYRLGILQGFRTCEKITQPSYEYWKSFSGCQKLFFRSFERKIHSILTQKTEQPQQDQHEG